MRTFRISAANREPSSRLGHLALLNLVIALAALLFMPSEVVADPASYYQLPGSSSEWIEGPIAGSDGSLWVAQSLSTGPFNSERHMRILHVATDGSIIATSPAQEGDPNFTQMAPASDGGLWVLAFEGHLEHVASNGTIQTVSLPSELDYSLTEGYDGRAWLQGCKFESEEREGKEFYLETCQALAVSPDGEVQAIDLPGLSSAWPPTVTSGGGFFENFPTAGGIWFAKFWGTNESAPTVSAEFVSYSGVTTPISLPSRALPVAPADADSAWWLEDNEKAGAELGKVDLNSTMSELHHLSNVSRLTEFNDPFIAGGGRDGDLLWAQNATWNDEYDGQIGVARVGGSNTEFMVEHDATAVPTSTPDFWSGTCTFGVKLYEAADGALWTISGGHPPRLTRQQLSGQFSTFLLGNGASAFAGEQESSLWGMVETDPHHLWFTLNTPTGPEIASLDPLNPPPAEPRMPKYTDEGVSGKARRPTLKSRIRRLLSALRRQTARAIAAAQSRTTSHPHTPKHRARQQQQRPFVTQTRHGYMRYFSWHRVPGHAPSIRVHGYFPTSGTARVVVKARNKIVLSGQLHGSTGQHGFTLHVQHGGKRSLSSSLGQRPTLIVSFQPVHGRTVRSTAKVQLRP